LLREPYCSGDCQKVDWKAHKPICKTLKKLSHQLQPYREVVQLIKKTCDEKFENIEMKIRVLNHVISYAEYKFGNRVSSRGYRERERGETIDNWTVEMEFLVRIHARLANLYLCYESLRTVSGSDLRFPLYEKELDLLRPWSADLDSNSTGRIDSMTKYQMNEILMRQK
jgi:hypothetical protein